MEPVKKQFTFDSVVTLTQKGDYKLSLGVRTSQYTDKAGISRVGHHYYLIVNHGTYTRNYALESKFLTYKDYNFLGHVLEFLQEVSEE